MEKTKASFCLVTCPVWFQLLSSRLVSFCFDELNCLSPLLGLGVMAGSGFSSWARGMEVLDGYRTGCQLEGMRQKYFVSSLRNSLPFQIYCMCVCVCVCAPTVERAHTMRAVSPTGELTLRQYHYMTTADMSTPGDPWG